MSRGRSSSWRLSGLSQRWSVELSCVYQKQQAEQMMLGLLAFVLFCEFQSPESSPFKTDRIGLLALLRGWFFASSSLGGLLRGGSLLRFLSCRRHLQNSFG